MRNVHCPSEGPSERAKLEQELEGVDIARCFIDFGDFNSQPRWRTGDHVPMPDVRTWRQNAGSPTFVSCIDGARLSDCFRGLATIPALWPVSGVQHRPVKLVIHVQPLTSYVRGKHFSGSQLGIKARWNRTSKLPGNSGTCCLGGSHSPARILRQCPWSSGWASDFESERVARL